jgi:succinate dehydrogenase / fumarate reductase, iron-sulfur subunit
MSANNIIFRILRFKPGMIDPPRFETYSLSAQPAMTVLEALEEIRLTLDETLIYRRSCHHGSCGTCACMINGVPKLACTTRIGDLESKEVTLEPLANHPCISDLAVAVDGFFKEIPAGWEYLRGCAQASKERTPQGVERLLRFENCIECGCCVAACPVLADAPEFLGPAALAALNNQRRKQPADEKALLGIAEGPGGAEQCRRHLACSRVCPTAVYPARHIAELQRDIRK